MLSGKRDKEIAALLNLSLNTVKTHLKSVYKKTGSRGRYALMVLAREGKESEEGNSLVRGIKNPKREISDIKDGGKDRKEHNMNKKNLVAGMAALMLSFAMVLAGCDNGGDGGGGDPAVKFPAACDDLIGTWAPASGNNTIAFERVSDAGKSDEVKTFVNGDETTYQLLSVSADGQAIKVKKSSAGTEHTVCTGWAIQSGANAGKLNMIDGRDDFSRFSNAMLTKKSTGGDVYTSYYDIRVAIYQMTSPKKPVKFWFDGDTEKGLTVSPEASQDFSVGIKSGQTKIKIEAEFADGSGGYVSAEWDFPWYRDSVYYENWVSEWGSFLRLVQDGN
jgi:hypothetical protein